MPTDFYNVEDYNARRSIGYLMRLSGKLVTQRIQELFIGEDITFVQWVTLMNLRDGLATTPAAMSQRLCHDAGAMTRLLDQMEQSGWIRRVRSKKDRRIVELELTQAGRAVTERFLPRLVDFYNGMFEDFTKAEAEQTIDLLTRLNRKLGPTEREL